PHDPPFRKSGRPMKMRISRFFFALRIVMVEWRFWASVMGLMRRSVRQLAGLSRLKAVSTD
ncbi:hypothetical protein, partial [Pseudomonas syringae]|uniref:hypothetical protein n=1 Tax=Pseudomonas syringae TaxID=317 RepID=UPI00196806CC